MIVDPRFYDEDGMFKARLSGLGDGNKPLYSVLTVSLMHAFLTMRFPDLLLWERMEVHGHYARFVYKFEKLQQLHEISPGLVRRTKTDPGQETWDNVFGWLAGSAVFERPAVARRILRHGLTHAGFFNTDGRLSWADWQWKHPHVWALGVPAGYRQLAPLYRPYQRALAGLLNADHPGGIMLDWTWFYACGALGMRHQKLRELTAKLPAAVMDQMDHGQPAVYLADRLAWSFARSR